MKEEIEDFDFVFVFQGRRAEMLEKWRQQITTELVSDKIQTKVIWSEKLKVTSLLVAINNPANVQIQAEMLGILKERTKKSFEFGKKDIHHLMETNRGNTSFIRYLQLIESRRLNQQIENQQRLSPFRVCKLDKFNEVQGGLHFTPDQQLRCKYNELLQWGIQRVNQDREQSVPFLVYPFQELMAERCFQQLFPIQKTSQYKTPNKSQVAQWYNFSIQKYAGPNVQVYFILIRFIQQWLWLPAAAGILTVMFNRFMHYTVDNSPADTLYSLLILFWSIIVVSKWQQFQKWIKFKNDRGFSDSWAHHQRKAFKDDGSLPQRTSLQTGQKQVYVPILATILLRLRTWLVILPVILVTLFFMVLSLNIRGLVQADHKLLYFQFVSRLTGPGGIFSKTSWRANIPMFLHVMILNYLDANVYRKLVVWSTKKEKHLSTKSYENHIIVKLMMFQAIITFTDMFYVAFVRFDIVGLKQQMSSLFLMDILRRFIAETLVHFVKRKASKKLKLASKDSEDTLLKQVERETSKVSYEPFDDYTQIVTNFGYLVMLSSAFPMAPAWIMLSHFLEVIHDKYKILFLYKRQLPRRFTGTGSWKQVLFGISCFSILTNIVLFAFSSQQVASFFPRLFEESKEVLLGNTQVLQFVSQAISNATDLVTPQVVTQLPLKCANTLFGQQPMLMSRTTPTKDNQSNFLLVVFIIQHLVLFAFLGIRKFLSGQKTLTEVFKERRSLRKNLKRKIDFGEVKMNDV